jgi:integrase
MKTQEALDRIRDVIRRQHKALSTEETIRDVGGYPANLIAGLLYGCGLRLNEPLNLRIKDVNLDQLRLCIRGAKGGNDRFVALPVSLVAELIQSLTA